MLHIKVVAKLHISSCLEETASNNPVSHQELPPAVESNTNVM